MIQPFSSFSDFDFSGDGVDGERITLFADEYFHVERVLATFDRPFVSILEVPPGIGAARIKLAGAALVRYHSSDRWHLTCPNTIGIRVGPNQMQVRSSKGFHELYTLYFRLDGINAIRHRVEEYQTQLSGQALNGIAPYVSMFPHFESSFEKFMAAIEPESALIAPMLLTSVVSDAFAFQLQQMRGSQLAPVPSGLPSTIQSLIESVRKNPASPWPLKQAAEEAGYSPYHLSRVFKQLVGFGFHEFVDRTRTEAAIENLCTSIDSVDYVAIKCGFGSTQAMRESIRTYAGLAPSAIRAEPKEDF